MACHNAGGPQGSVGSEYGTWLTADPHARAYTVLLSARSQQIEKNYRQLKTLDEARAERDQECLRCHSINRPEGGSVSEAILADAEKGGILVSTMSEPFGNQTRELGVRAAHYTVQESGEELREIGTLIDAGKVKLKISKVFDFHDVGSAFEYVEKGDTEGKVVLKVSA